jgi:hypothetical protein
MMLPLGDPRWSELHGGYKQPYDPSVALNRLASGEDTWDELWENLHHQGDVGESSYATVPHLVRIASDSDSRDWQVYALLSTIEIERHRKSNPPIPDWLAAGYSAAWNRLLQLAIEDIQHVDDGLSVRSILGAIALAKNQLKLGALLSDVDDSEIDEILEKSHEWSTCYLHKPQP